MHPRVSLHVFILRQLLISCFTISYRVYYRWGRSHLKELWRRIKIEYCGRWDGYNPNLRIMAKHSSVCFRSIVYQQGILVDHVINSTVVSSRRVCCSTHACAHDARTRTHARARWALLVILSGRRTHAVAIWCAVRSVNHGVTLPVYTTARRRAWGVINQKAR